VDPPQPPLFDRVPLRRGAPKPNCFPVGPTTIGPPEGGPRGFHCKRVNRKNDGNPFHHKKIQKRMCVICRKKCPGDGRTGTPDVVTEAKCPRKIFGSWNIRVTPMQHMPSSTRVTGGHTLWTPGFIHARDRMGAASRPPHRDGRDAGHRGGTFDRGLTRVAGGGGAEGSTSRVCPRTDGSGEGQVRRSDRPERESGARGLAMGLGDEPALPEHVQPRPPHLHRERLWGPASGGKGRRGVPFPSNAP